MARALQSQVWQQVLQLTRAWRASFATTFGILTMRATLAALVIAPLACTNAVDDPARDERGPLARAFADAATESGVPEELLLAVGYVETRWQMPTSAGAPQVDDEHGRHAVGMMGVVDRADDPRLATAAAHLDVDAALARTDALVHVRVAAEALRAFGAASTDDGALPATLTGWKRALIAYGADGDDEVGQDYARTVFAVIDAGARAFASTGEELVLAGHGKPARDAKTQALVAGANSELVDAYLQARAGHFHRGRSQAIDRVVIHTTEGSYSGAISWFRSANNPYQTSAHYVIRSSDGEITQMVSEEDTAYHVLNWNSRAVGIEHEAISAQASWFTAAMYEQSAMLTRDICLRHGIPMDRQHIVGHVEVPGNDHSDPGVHWNWDHYLALVTSGQSLPPPDDVGAPGNACDGLDYFGACDGAVLAWCENGVAHSVDCGARAQVCAWQDDVVGNNCVTGAVDAPIDAPVDQPVDEPIDEPIDEDGCAGIDYFGVCDGATLVWCESDALRTYDCGITGDACGWQDDVVGNNCVSADAAPTEEPAPVEPVDGCNGVDYSGYCDGAVLVWCDADTLQSFDCGSTGQVCGWQNDDIGNNCL